MEDQLKEIEGLLESARPDDDENATPLRNIKKYIKLAFPHVALVAVVCLYATIGAYIFYRLESPNEDRLKAIGRKSIADMRTSLIAQINTNDGGLEADRWKESVETELMQYSDKLYKAFKEQYVRYSDVKLIDLNSRSTSEEDDEESDRKRRHRHGKTRGDKSGSEKMWTASSSLFFAATTMATIGYGNIVPATSSGRIACVIFALFGAPLAIITIGDLGKFLSECTIWLYKHMRKMGNQFQIFVKRLRGLEIDPQDLENGVGRRKNSQDPDSSSVLDWEDLVIDKTEVPVMMVFTILLLYIAFGGILFSILEDWSYMDAFYYSFISLTTIGFGDIVPENHDYIVIMLIYLGVGLSVTTMCIDLVGIQYIQKIHYFGRKFRGTDLLHLLKRKRMIERRLAMGQGEDILRMYVQQIEKEAEQIHQLEDEVPPLEPKLINNSMMRIDDSLSAFNLRFYDTYDEEDIFCPSAHSIRSYQPSIWTNSSARSNIYSHFIRQRGASWDESGPSISERCSLSTEPSVHIRQDYWDNYQSPTPSVLSFLHRHLYSPSVASSVSVDYENIASNTKHSKRSGSCPTINIPSPLSHGSPIGLACMQDWDSYIQMLEEAAKSFEYPPECIDEEDEEEDLHDERLDEERQCTPHILQSDSHPTFTTSSVSSPQRQLHFASRVFYQPPPISEMLEQIQKTIKYESSDEERLEEMKAPSPIPMDPQSSESEEEPTIVNCEKLKSSQNEIDLGAFELVDSGLTPEALLSKDEPVIFHQQMPVHSVHHDTVQTEAALANLMSAPSSMLTDSIPPVMVEDNYCFVVDGERVRMGDILGDDQWWRHTSRPTKYFYSDDLRQFHRVNCITAKGKVITAKLAAQLPQQPSTSSMSASKSHHQSLSAASFHAPVHPQHHSMTNTPRSSISGATSSSRLGHHDANKVPLNNVYKVIRFYSFWKTCTSFHRIVTMIDKVVDEPSITTSSGNQFKKRLFVQYLWRNAKAVEKARVQKEFDPRRQRLLRFVTDPAARKRFSKM